METDKKKPIKRAEQIKPLSRDHHHGLLLCWKIRRGFSTNVGPERMKKYADWFYKEHLLPHFEIEEKWMFPVLGNEHELIKKALAEHRRLRRLFGANEDFVKSLSLIEEELEKHIRFEERVLFNEIQKVATDEEMDKIQAMHSDGKFEENTQDEFWK